MAFFGNSTTQTASLFDFRHDRAAMPRLGPMPGHMKRQSFYHQLLPSRVLCLGKQRATIGIIGQSFFNHSPARTARDPTTGQGATLKASSTDSASTDSDAVPNAAASDETSELERDSSEVARHNDLCANGQAELTNAEVESPKDRLRELEAQAAGVAPVEVALPGLTHFASVCFKDSGASGKTVEQLVEAGLVTDLPDFYTMDPGALAELIGPVRAQKLVDSVAASRSMSAANLLKSLNIPNVGPKTAAALGKAFPRVADLLNAQAEQIKAAAAVNKVVSSAVADWFAKPGNQDLLAALEGAGVQCIQGPPQQQQQQLEVEDSSGTAGAIDAAAGAPATGPAGRLQGLQGKRICIIGKIKGPNGVKMTHPEAKALLRSWGAEVHGRVRTDTELLLVAPGTSVIYSAETARGVQVVESDDFWRTYKRGFAGGETGTGASGGLGDGGSVTAVAEQPKQAVNALADKVASVVLASTCWRSSSGSGSSSEGEEAQADAEAANASGSSREGEEVQAQAQVDAEATTESGSSNEEDEALAGAEAANDSASSTEGEQEQVEAEVKPHDLLGMRIYISGVMQGPDGAKITRPEIEKYGSSIGDGDNGTGGSSGLGAGASGTTVADLPKLYNMESTRVALLGTFKGPKGQGMTLVQMKYALKAAGAICLTAPDRFTRLVVVGSGGPPDTAAATAAEALAEVKGRGVVLREEEFWKVFGSPPVAEDLKQTFTEVFFTLPQKIHRFARVCLQGSRPEEPIPWLEPLVRRLVEAGRITSPADLYTLDMASLPALPGYGPAEQAALAATVEASRSMPLSRLLQGLDIRAVSENQATRLGAVFTTMRDLAETRSSEVIAEKAGIEHASAAPLADWLADPSNKALMRRLHDAGVACVGGGWLSVGKLEAEKAKKKEAEARVRQLQEELEATPGQLGVVPPALRQECAEKGLLTHLRGRSVCMTGILMGPSQRVPITRNRVKEIFNEAHVRITGQVSTATVLLVTGRRPGDNTLHAARTAGIPIIDEQTFWKYYGGRSKS